jgi:hypothetical protein
MGAFVASRSFSYERGRVKATAFLLRYCEGRACAVLEAEAKGKGLLALSQKDFAAQQQFGEAILQAVMK